MSARECKDFYFIFLNEGKDTAGINMFGSLLSAEKEIMFENLIREKISLEVSSNIH